LAGSALLEVEGLVAGYSVAENLVLGQEPTRTGQLDRARAAREVQELSERIGLRVPADRKVSELSVGEAQRVEILKALYRGARILILDEPTAVLTPQETQEIFAVLRRLRDEGHSIIFISHKLYEVLEIADRITVIRRGTVVGEASPEASNAELAALMVGRPVELKVHKDPAEPGERALVVSDLTVADEDGYVHVDGISFHIDAGEILAVAGVQGNGKTELTEAMVGLAPHVEGSIRLDGREIVGRSVRKALEAGIGFIPEDRQVEGLVGNFTIAENLMLNRSYDKTFVSRGSLNLRTLDRFAKEKLAEYDVRAPGVSTLAGQLSGGNQQKVVVARELSRDLRLLVASQPTRGVDVGSIEFIHKQIVAARDSGVPVLVVSSELDEISALADRIMVLYRGRVVGIVPADTSRDTLGLMMAGESPEGSEA
jgi:general nucleoside transport system ATP-binding protein